MKKSGFLGTVLSIFRVSPLFRHNVALISPAFRRNFAAAPIASSRALRAAPAAKIRFLRKEKASDRKQEKSLLRLSVQRLENTFCRFRVAALWRLADFAAAFLFTVLKGEGVPLYGALS